MPAQTTNVHTLDPVIPSLEMYQTDMIAHLQNALCRGCLLQQCFTSKRLDPLKSLNVDQQGTHL